MKTIQEKIAYHSLKKYESYVQKYATYITDSVAECPSEEHLKVAIKDSKEFMFQLDRLTRMLIHARELFKEDLND